MQLFNPELLKQIYIPPPDSHKGQNGKLLIIGGSHLFHVASLWALQIASKVVDMVFYSSVPENNEIVQRAKEEFRNGIVVRREDVQSYVEEANCILIGPGMVRDQRSKIKDQKYKSKIKDLKQIDSLQDEGEQTYWLTNYILENYPDKRFVLDAGALQMMEPEWLIELNETPIITPHTREFDVLKLKSPHFAQPSPRLWPASKASRGEQNSQPEADQPLAEEIEEQVAIFSQEYKCVVLLKGQEDSICSPEECIKVSGGNAGMTKGGTGDVLAGLVGALYCKNDPFLSAMSASYICKKAGESLSKRVGNYFNASDLVDEIPHVMKKLLH